MPPRPEDEVRFGADTTGGTDGVEGRVVGGGSDVEKFGGGVCERKDVVKEGASCTKELAFGGGEVGGYEEV